MSLLLEALVKSTLVLLIAGAFASPSGRTTAALRSRIWLIALLALLVLPISLCMRPLVSLPIPAPATQGPTNPPFHILSGMSSSGATVARYHSASANIVKEGAGQTERSRPPHPAVSMRSLLSLRGGPFVPALPAALYSLGAFLALTRLARSHRELLRLAQAGRAIELPEWEQAARALAPSGPVHVLVSEDVPVPMTYGWRRPLILLPPAATEGSPDFRRSLLYHEAAHLRRRDWICFLVADLVCAFWWFHPLVWQAAARLRAETEFACDALVLSHGIAPACYAESLLEAVTMLSRPVCAPAIARSHRVEARVRAILAYVPARPSRHASTLLSLWSLCALGLVFVRPNAGAQALKSPAHSGGGRGDAQRASSVALRLAAAFSGREAARAMGPTADERHDETVSLRWLDADRVPTLVRSISGLEQVTVDLRLNTVALRGSAAALAAAKKKIAEADAETPAYRLTARIISYRVDSKGRSSESVLFEPVVMVNNGNKAWVHIEFNDPKRHPAPTGTGKIRGYGWAVTPTQNPNGTVSIAAEIQELGERSEVLCSGRNMTTVPLNRLSRVVGMTDVRDSYYGPAFLRQVEQGQIVRDHPYPGLYVELKAELVSPSERAALPK